MVRLVLVAASVTLTVVLLAGCGGGGDEGAKVEANLQRFLATPERSPGFPVGGGPPRVKGSSCFKVEGSHAVLRLITAKDVPPGMKVVLPPGEKVVLLPGRNVVLAPGMKIFAPPGWRSLGTGVSASNWNCVVKIGTTVAIPVIVTVNDENNDVLMAGPRLPNTQSEPRIYENTCKPEPKTRTRSTCTKAERGSVSPAG